MFDKFKASWNPGSHVIYILQSNRSGSKPRYCSSLCPWTSFSARQCSWTFPPRERKRWPHAGYYGCQSRSPCHDGCWDLRWCCLCRKEASARSKKSVAVNEQRPQHLSTNKVLAYSRTFNHFTVCLPAHLPMPKTEKVTHVLFRCDDLHLHDGLLRFIRIEVLGGLNDKGSHIARWKTRRSDTASNLPVKWHGFLHLLATVVSQAQRFLQFVPPGWSMSFSFISISSPLYQAPRVLFCLHPWHYCIIGLQPSDHDNGLGFASTFLEGCSGRNLEGNGGGVNWVESTILRVKWLWASRSRLSATFTCIYCLFTQNYQQKIK